MFLFYLAAYVFIFVSAGTAVSHHFLWKHLKKVEENISLIFKGKSDEEIYQFVYGGGEVQAACDKKEKLPSAREQICKANKLVRLSMIISIISVTISGIALLLRLIF